MRTRRNTSRSDAAYERISSIDSGSTDVSPRNVFTSTGKKHRTAAIVTFDHGLRSPNHAFVIGAKAMIGIAFAAIMYGISASPNGRHAGEDERDDDRSAASEDESADASLKVIHAPRRSRCVLVPRALRRRRRTSAAESPPPRARPGETTATPRGRERRPRPRAPSRGFARRDGATRRSGLRTAHAISPSAARVSSTSSAPVACSDSRTSVTSSKNRGLLPRRRRTRLR